MTLSKRTQYLLQAVAVYTLYGLLRCLPVAWASGLGGAVLRAIGPHMGISRRAMANLRIAFPEKTENEQRAIVRGMWENLGRLAGEYPHLNRMAAFTEVAGLEHLHAASTAGQPCLFLSAHLANWEICPFAARAAGTECAVVFRRPNNVWVDGLLGRARSAGAVQQIPKGRTGARQIVARLKDRGIVAMLMDQRMGEGMDIPFFGQPAMTGDAIVFLARKFKCPVYPIRATRVKGHRLRVTVFPPLDWTQADTQDAARKALTDMNALLEQWVRATPHEWLWIHNRWRMKGRNRQGHGA